MEPGIWAGDAAGGAGRGVGERPAVVSGFAAGPGIEVAVGVRGGTDRLAFEETSAGSSPFCGPLYRCGLSADPAQRDRIVPLLSFPFAARMRGYRHPSARRVREGERDRPMPGNEGFRAGL